MRFIRTANDFSLQILVGCMFGCIVGMAFAFLPPLYVIGGLLGLIVVLLILQRPEVGVLGILIATSSILYEDQLPVLDIGISLHSPDLILLTLLGLILIRSLVERDFRLVRTPLDLPLLIFIGINIASTLIALMNASVAFHVARRMLRFFSYYLVFFIATNLLRDRKQLHFLFHGLVVLASVVAGAIVLQFFMGSSVQILPGRVEVLATQGNEFEEVTRILPPGWSVVLVCFLVFFCLLATQQSNAFTKTIQILLMCLFGLALVLTFLRSFWAAVLAAIGLAVLLFDRTERWRIGRISLLILILATALYSTITTNPESRVMQLSLATLDRFSTLFNSNTFEGEGDTLGFRLIENEYAYAAIAQHPWLGMGMGFTYRPWDSRLDQSGNSAGNDFRRHIHNGHLWIMLQSGLLGYASLMWLSGVFLWRGLRNWRHIPDPKLRAMMLGFSLVYVAVMIAAIVNSSFTQWRWTPLLGMMMGINEGIQRLSPPRTKGSPIPTMHRR